MSVDEFKQQVDRQIDLYGMAQFSRGFEACIEALDELSKQLRIDWITLGH